MFPEFPNPDTIYEYRRKHPKFAELYARAKQFQAEIMAEELDDVIDSANQHVYKDERGVNRLDAGMLGHVRLQVDTIKWTAAKLAPKIYGDRMQVETKSNEDTEALKAELKELRAKLAEKSKSEY